MSKLKGAMEALKGLSNKDKVNIKNKMYVQVATRVEAFREAYLDEAAIITDLEFADNSRVVVKASIIVGGQIVATGYGEEYRAANPINKTSAVENCETSAIGRALANLGLIGGEYGRFGRGLIPFVW